MSKQKQKEPLPLMIAKTVLAIAVFTGLGTIIIGGGVVIMKYYNSEVNNRIVEPVNQETENYYDALEKRCAGNKCCLSSFRTMKANNYKEADENGKCPEGFFMDMTKCKTSYQWCVPMEKVEINQKYYCEKDNDCLATCSSPGCYNKNWYETVMRRDCEALILHTCKCVNNKCQRLEDQLDTSDWQTYRNEEYGFEVKYPEYFNLSEKNNIISLINFYDSSQEIEILKSSSPPSETMDMELIGTHKVLVDGYVSNIELFQGRLDNNKNKYYLRVFISEKDIFYHAETDKGNMEELSLIFNQILSSFKFTD